MYEKERKKIMSLKKTRGETKTEEKGKRRKQKECKRMRDDQKYASVGAKK